MSPIHMWYVVMPIWIINPHSASVRIRIQMRIRIQRGKNAESLPK